MLEFYQRNAVTLKAVNFEGYGALEVVKTENVCVDVTQEALALTSSVLSGDESRRAVSADYLTNLVKKHDFSWVIGSVWNYSELGKLGEAYGLALDMVFRHGTDEQKNEIQEALFTTLKLPQTTWEEKRLVCDIIGQAVTRFASQSKEYRKFAGSWVRGTLDALGLNAAELISSWTKSASDLQKNYSVSLRVLMDNFRSTTHLEANYPGIIQYFMQECHVMDFARYPGDALIEQFQERSNTQKQYVTFVFPRDDHNASFTRLKIKDKNNMDIIDNNVRQSVNTIYKKAKELGYLVRFIEAEEGDELKDIALGQFMGTRSYPPTALLFLATHSDTEALVYGYFPSDVGRGEVTIEDVKQGKLDWINEFLMKEGTCVLWGCEAGQKQGVLEQLQGGNNPHFAEQLKMRLPERKVIGSPIQTLEERTDIFKKNGVLGAKVVFVQEVLGKKIPRRGVVYK